MPHFSTKLNVRTYECDLYGHVNNATFLNYLEYGRVEFLKKMGYSLHSLREMGILLLILKIEIEYKKPAYPGDDLVITIDWIKRGNSSAVFNQRIIREADDQTVADALVTWVVTDMKGKPMAVPAELTESFRQAFGADI